MADNSPHSSAWPPDASASEYTDVFSDAWECIGVGLCLTDTDGAIRAVNPAFTAITGYSRDELLGVSLVRLHPAEAVAGAAAAHAAIIAGSEPPPHATFRHKNGDPLFVHTSDARIVSNSGVIFRLTTLVDLEAAARGEARLEQIQRAENFVALAGTISNDFNNLLAIILGYAGFVQDGAGDPRKIEVAVRGIESAVRRAADLIKQTLYLTRQTTPDFQKVDLGSLADEISRGLLANAAWDLQVELVLQRDLPSTSLDPRHVNHVAVELCRRAIETLGFGLRVRFMTQTIPGAQLQPRFCEVCEPLYVMLEVRFSGPTSQSTKRGSGWDNRRDLALVAMESVMASHRGCCERVVVEERDIAFRMYFPTFSEPLTNPVVPTLGPIVPPVQGVLIIDDEESLLHALGFALERHGCRVWKARSGVEAVDLFRLHHRSIGVVLCDLGLPGMSGWEAFMKMKEIAPAVRVVVMSGHLEPTLHAEMLRSGARGFLQKPFSIVTAVNQVQQLLQATG